MIKLAKSDIPDVLARNEQGWTNNLREKLARGETPTEAEKSRYRHPEIKASLVNETSGKCAYCESKILHIAFGDVEHIAPKSRNIENLFKWSNLTLACDRCNTYKGDTEGLLDPYTEDPAEAFEFLGPMIIPHPADEVAIFTERCLKLNREDLRERRGEKIKYLADQLVILSQSKSPALQAVLRRDILENETSPTQEFSATARSFLQVMLPKVVEKASETP